MGSIGISIYKLVFVFAFLSVELWANKHVKFIAL